MLCVYAVIGGRRTVAARGPAGEALKAVAAGRFSAIVGESSRPPRASRDSLRRHDAIIRTLWLTAPALLPARFGTCFNRADELALALRSRERTLLRDLRHVRGRAQMTIRILGSGLTAQDSGTNPEALSREPGARDSGTSYLRARAAEAARAREIPGFDRCRDAVRRWVRDEKVETTDQGRAAVVSVYHLVPRGSVEAYRRAIEHAAAASDVRVIVSGPHPPYAFS